MNELSHLDNCVDLHLSHGSWDEFLEYGCEFMASGHNWKWHRKVNCHYFVKPDGTVVKGIYGYRGKNYWNTLMDELS